MSGLRLWLMAIGVGLVVGGASLYPYFATAGGAHLLGNSAAIWLAGAFLMGAVAGSPLRGAITGLVMLLATLSAFFLGAQLLYPVGGLTSAVLHGLTIWGLPALAGGSLYGALGSLWRAGGHRAQGLASAAMGAAFLAEAAYTAAAGLLPAVIIEAVAGVALTLALARGRRARLAALCALPALAAVGFVAWFAAWRLVTALAVHH